jgi:hypothetical protein
MEAILMYSSTERKKKHFTAVISERCSQKPTSYFTKQTINAQN